ncbi:hypothetical protein [Petrachloros mirabilis]
MLIWLEKMREIAAEGSKRYNEEWHHGALARLSSPAYRAKITVRGSPLPLIL